MAQRDAPVDKLIASLQERAKELNCLYQVEQVLNRSELPLRQALQAVVDAIPPGWQYPDVCKAMISYGELVLRSDDFELTDWVQTADIVVQDQVVGKLHVCYVEERPKEAIGPFLAEEERLIRTIAERVSHFILFQQLEEMRRQWEVASRSGQTAHGEASWLGPIELLRRSDRTLYLRIARKMLNHLCWIGIEEAQALLQGADSDGVDETAEPATGEANYPSRVPAFDRSLLDAGTPFEIARACLGNDEILALVQRWILEDKISFFPKVLHDASSTLPEIAEGLRRFHHAVADAELPESTLNGMRVALIRRFLTEHLDFIKVAKRYVDPADFAGLLDRVVFLPDSEGKLGGKSAGLLLAEWILAKSTAPDLPKGTVRVPKSWYIASDGLMGFVAYNELEEVLEQKYRDIAQVRQEYPNIVQLFKSSRFPPDLVRGLSMALDDLAEAPIVVRSSSLLEDRLGSAFSGKYKSLFLANQGSKQERLAALLDAISEIYASVFGPEPIEYRAERGLLDFYEEMGILIQEVVGTHLGRYFLPAYAGVAFSNNELRWSPRIRLKDGLIRLVPGLGTRAVNRMGDDYPILAVPGQPGLRVNTSVDELVRYSPQAADVINLESGRFESVELQRLLEEHGAAYPAFDKVFSVLADGHLQRVTPITDPQRERLVTTFDGLIEGTAFMQQVGSILALLEQALGSPVYLELASDGTDLFLLQCRSQSYPPEEAPAPIPHDLPARSVLFSADRHVSNGWVPDISHIVYVDPERYARLTERSDMLRVGSVVGKLNKTLPKRRFILMGPGRWGSRGDITLGVRVGYSDINNSAMLIEIGRMHGQDLPDLSFGIHFFQDLVEASIRYLPLYPDSPGGFLDEQFLLEQPNLLADMLPEDHDLAETVRVIDVPTVANGRLLRVLMNADLDKAVGLLVNPEEELRAPSQASDADLRPVSEEYWRWRLRMAERIAAEIDGEHFGVRAMYVFGSTKNANAGPKSDIDLLVHFRGDDEQRRQLLVWLDGWSHCLGEMNYLRTGYASEGLLDVHLVSDEDIAQRTSFAAKIGAVSDGARQLPMQSTRSG